MKETITIGNKSRTIGYETGTLPYFNEPDVIYYGTICSIIFLLIL